MTPSVPRELEAYQDEPPQHPSGAFGKNALLRLRFERRGEKSILAFSERRAPLLVQRALYCDEGMPSLPVVFVISNSGGILQGDRYRLEFEASPGAFGHVTTQAATKIHEMDVNHATQDQEIIVHDGAYLEYLPEQTIPFARSRFLTRTRLQVAPSATLLYSEVLVGGRKHYGDGELFRFDLFSSSVVAERPDGAELFAEKFVIEPARDAVGGPAVIGPFHVFGNVLLLTPKAVADRVLGLAASAYDRDGQWAAGASRLPNDAGVVYKVLGMEASVVRARVRDFWSIVRPEVTGFHVPDEFPWR